MVARDGVHKNLWKPSDVRLKVTFALLVVFDRLPHLAYACLDLGLQPLLFGHVPFDDRLPIVNQQ